MIIIPKKRNFNSHQKALLFILIFQLSSFIEKKLEIYRVVWYSQYNGNNHPFNFLFFVSLYLHQKKKLSNKKIDWSVFCNMYLYIYLSRSKMNIFSNMQVVSLKFLHSFIPVRWNALLLLIIIIILMMLWWWWSWETCNKQQHFTK